MCVDELKRYKIVYTGAAEEDVFSKAEYIEKAYGQGIREYVLRNDIVLYSVDERSASVLIHAAFTRGKISLKTFGKNRLFS